MNTPASTARAFLRALASTFLALACALAAHRLLQAPQGYSQLVVGTLAWDGSSKAGDLPAALVFMLALPAAWFVLGAATAAYDAEASDCVPSLLLACAPGVFFVSQALFLPWTGTSWLFVSAGLIAWWIAIPWATTPSARAPQSPSPAVVADGPMVLLLVPILCGFSALGAMLLCNRALLLDVRAPVFLLGFVAGATAVATVLRRQGGRSPSHKMWTRLLLCSQAGIPLLALGLIPTPLLRGAALDHPVPVSGSLVVLTAALALALSFDIRRSVRLDAGDRPVARISPLALFACLWILRTPFTEVPSLSTDDWHFGELMLPWTQWRDHALVPFADLIPVRGFISLADAGLAQLLAGGSAADLAHVRPAMALLYSLVAFAAMRFAAGTLPALVVVAVLDFSSPITRIDYLYVGGVCLQIGLILRGRPSAAALAWLMSSLAFAVLAPGQALLYGAATSPLLLHATIRANRRTRLRMIGVAGLVAAVVAAVFLLDPMPGRIGAGMRIYFADNVAINTTGSGIPWSDSFGGGRGNPVVREMFRSFFLVVAGAALWAGFGHLRRPSPSGTPSGTSSASPLRDRVARLARVDVAIAATVVLTMLLFLPRVLGRVDTDSASRLGALTLLGCALVLLLVPRRSGAVTRGAIALTAFFVATGTQKIGVPPNDGASAFASGLLTLPRQFNAADGLVDESVSRLHRVGTIRFDADHLDELRHVHRLLDELLPPGTPYYDFSNRTAHYVYFDRPVATRWSSPYYLADERAQLRTAGELAARRVPLLLLGASNLVHDGGGAALRSYWLYRHVLSGYVPFDREGYVFAVRRDLSAQPSFAASIDPLGSDVALFEDVFGVADLKRIPRSWGASEGTLQASFGPERVDARPTSMADGRTALDADSSEAESAGLGRFDILRLSLRCERADASVRLAWSGRRRGATTRYELAFEGASGVLLVPVGSRPGWVMAETITDVSIDALSSGCHVDAAQWLRRRQPPS